MTAILKNDSGSQGRTFSTSGPEQETGVLTYGLWLSVSGYADTDIAYDDKD
jgi:hypothetical protein